MNAKTATTTETITDTNEATGNSAAQGRKAKRDLGLSPELTELVVELKETVKRITPQKHTPRTLRRALTLVNAVIGDIEQLTLEGNR